MSAIAAPVTTARLYVGSEVGALRRVVLHRPDLELQRLTPPTRTSCSSTTCCGSRRARQEHDAFADALRERGIEVLYSAGCWPRRSTLDGVRERSSTQTLGELDLGPRLREELRELAGGPPRRASSPSVLIGGVALDELPFRPSVLAAAVDRADGFVLAPLPNHLFTRDTSCWVYGGVSVNHMAKPARRREAVHLERDLPPPPAVRRRASARSGATRPRRRRAAGGRRRPRARPRRRARRDGRAHPARRGRGAGPAPVRTPARRARCIAVDLPKQRSSMHLDTVMTMVDVDAFTVYPGVVAGADATASPAPARRRRRTRRRRCSTRSPPPSASPQLRALRDRRRPLRGRARAVGRRQQRAGDRAGRRRRLRAQRRHQHAPAPGGHRGHHDRRRRARARPRRPALHVLPDRPRRPAGGPDCRPRWP